MTLIPWQEADGWSVKYEVRSTDRTLIASYDHISDAMTCAYAVIADGPVDICEVRYRKVASLTQRMEA